MKDNEIHHRRVGLRWGRIVAGAEQMRIGIQAVRNGRDLLPPVLVQRVNELSAEFIDLEQRLWEAEQQEVSAAKPKKGRKRK